MVKNSTKITPAITLPDATKHQVEHLFDCPLTFDEYAEHLKVCDQQISWLRSLLRAIQADDDVQSGFVVAHLAEIGDHLASSWLSQIRKRQKDFEITLAHSAS